MIDISTHVVKSFILAQILFTIRKVIRRQGLIDSIYKMKMRVR